MTTVHTTPPNILLIVVDDLGFSDPAHLAERSRHHI